MSGMLAIDTSTRSGSVAAAGPDGFLATETFVSDRSHNSQLFAPLQRVVAASGGMASLKGGTVFVGRGPGSYTGIRVGIAAAQAIGLAAGMKVVGVPSASAADIDADDYWICGDARMGGFFLLEIRGRRPSGEIELPGPTGFAERIRALVAAGQVVVTFDPEPPILGITLARPEAGRLAAAAGSPDAIGGPIEPIYLRAPFVTQPGS